MSACVRFCFLCFTVTEVDIPAVQLAPVTAGSIYSGHINTRLWFCIEVALWLCFDLQREPIDAQYNLRACLYETGLVLWSGEDWTGRTCKQSYRHRCLWGYSYERTYLHSQFVENGMLCGSWWGFKKNKTEGNPPEESLCPPWDHKQPLVTHFSGEWGHWLLSTQSLWSVILILPDGYLRATFFWQIRLMYQQWPLFYTH